MCSLNLILKEAKKANMITKLNCQSVIENWENQSLMLMNKITLKLNNLIVENLFVPFYKP